MNTAKEGDAGKFANFMDLHRKMLECYATNGMNPAVYKSMDAATQHDFCYSQRTRLEDQLFKKKVSPQDFFKAAQ